MGFQGEWNTLASFFAHSVKVCASLLYLWLKYIIKGRANKCSPAIIYKFATCFTDDGIRCKNVNVMNAEEWYKEGNLHRRHQNWQGALDCYRKAIELDEASPAVHARQMLLDILEFYNKDMYNP